jgi:hypothetical protein
VKFNGIQKFRDRIDLPPVGFRPVVVDAEDIFILPIFVPRLGRPENSQETRDLRLFSMGTRSGKGFNIFIADDEEKSELASLLTGNSMKWGTAIAGSKR